MKKITKFLGKYKLMSIIAGGLLFGIVLVFFIIYFVMPSIGDNNYGERLKDESKYKITSKQIDKIKDTVSELDGVSKITYHKEGRVLNFTIELEDGVVLDTAKNYAGEIISKLSEKNLKYYDVQVFLDSENDPYPIIGYYPKGGRSFSWGNVGGN